MSYGHWAVDAEGAPLPRRKEWRARARRTGGRHDCPEGLRGAATLLEHPTRHTRRDVPPRRVIYGLPDLGPVHPGGEPTVGLCTWGSSPGRSTGYFGGCIPTWIFQRIIEIWSLEPQSLFNVIIILFAILGRSFW